MNENLIQSCIWNGLYFGSKYLPSLQLVNNSRSGNKDTEEERGHRDIGCGKERVWPEYDGVSCNTVMCTLIANYDLFTFSMFLTDWQFRTLSYPEFASVKFEAVSGDW